MVKPLYMAKNIEELQRIGSLPTDTPLRRLMISSKKLLDAAEKCFLEKDEERAYVMYIKVLQIVQNIQKTGSKQEQKEQLNTYLGSANVKKALVRLEKLQTSLDNRYAVEYSIPETNVVVEPKKEVKKKTSTSVILTEEEKAEKNGLITCKKLYSLITQKSTSFLLVDVRSKDQYEFSSIGIPNSINMPEEILKDCLTANKAGHCIDEHSQLMWTKRASYDLIIICDLKSEQPPFPRPIKVVIDAMSKWDPGTSYKSKPRVLSSGFELFSMMYPTLVRNPQANQDQLRVAPRTPNNNLFNFEYPDLDTGFVETPSPPKPIALNPEPIPIVNRTLKPTPAPEPITNGVSQLVEKFDSLASKPKTRSNSIRHTIEAEVLPDIPNRTLKPMELLERLNTDMDNLDKERETLEKSMANEQETLDKLQEMEQTKKRKEATEDISQRYILSKTEQHLRDDMAKLKNRSKKLESDYDAISKQNQQLWTVLKDYLSDKESSGKTKTTSVSDTQKEEVELIARNHKMELLHRDVDVLRKKRKERELKFASQLNGNKALDNGTSNKNTGSSHQSQPSERTSRPKLQLNGDNSASTRRRGDTFTATLKSSPRSSPVRGGTTNLTRSHSAFNLAALRDDDLLESPACHPMFDRRLKPMDSPQRRTLNAARHRNFEPKSGNLGRGKTGLKNLGNTCYMNSIIQCLNNTIPLAQFFMTNSYSDKINENSRQRGMVAEEMAAVIRALWGGHYKSISMWDLKNIVAKHHKPFFGFDQQDSHEFLLKLMDWLNDDLNMIKVKPTAQMLEQNFEDVPDYLAAEKVTNEMNSRDNSIVTTLFHGLHQSVITCTTCQHRSITFEPFSVLTISLPTNGPCSLAEQIREYYRLSEIEYKCARCKKQRICTRKMNIWQLPPVLLIHLNRFEHDVLMKKNPNFVDFPTEGLDLAPYVVSDNNKYEIFDLYACSNHYGTMDGGHYTAFCHSKKYEWLKFDDNEVYELPLKSVKTSAAYILFYQAANLNSIVI